MSTPTKPGYYWARWGRNKEWIVVLVEFAEAEEWQEGAMTFPYVYVFKESQPQPDSAFEWGERVER